MFSESTNDKVWSINSSTGDVINPNYIPTDPVNLNTPTQARLSPRGKITISDQNNDGVLLMIRLVFHLEFCTCRWSKLNSYG
ncbi:MAG: hypothetical protein IPI19_16235 [Ignavibacteriales bacterium]|nr:hypothetical protein [Ignavibacteriales bacterium]